MMEVVVTVGHGGARDGRRGSATTSTTSTTAVAASGISGRCSNSSGSILLRLVARHPNPSGRNPPSGNLK